MGGKKGRDGKKEWNGPEIYTYRGTRTHVLRIRGRAAYPLSHERGGGKGWILNLKRWKEGGGGEADGG